MTTRLNIPWRRQHGGLETDLHNFPAAIKDAIKLVQKLNLRYLWVDAICIVQDSAASFRLNAADMHTIYGNAHFTICAADGIDADTGLRAMENNIDENTAIQDTEEVVPGLRLQIARPPEMVIKDTKWNTRGWTFQERILSRRCVVFADGRAYFQCRKAAFSEDVHNDAKGSGWSLQAMGAPLRSFPEIKQRSFSFYMRCVAMFYRRDLTRPSDILAAFKGIQSVMELVMNAPFCYGLPTSHFDLALLWQPTKAIRRRIPAARQNPEHCTTTHEGHCDCKLQGDDFNGQEFPSWSWSGWTGGDICYDPATLEGSLLTVREWLRDHTWVRYHVLDGRGKLRPLWDISRVLEDNSFEHRWRGYVGRQIQQDYSIPDAIASDSDSNSDDDAQVGVHYRKQAYPRPDPTYAYNGHNGNAGNIAEKFDFAEDLEHRSRNPTKAENGYAYLQSNARDENRFRVRERNDNDNYPRRRSRSASSSVRDRSRSRGRRPYTARYDGRPEREKVVIMEESLPWIARHQEDIVKGTYVPVDSWGRFLYETPSHESYRADHFSRTHPENPYRVCKTTWDWPDLSRDFPDLPILQFWTRLKHLRVISVTEMKGTGLTRCHVGDSADDWCGTVTVNSDWIEQHDGEMVSFIALSEAKSFTEEEDPNWNYYTPRERGESEWEVFYALLVELNEQKHVWERVGLAKIFKGAFDGECWTEIMLG